MTAETLPPPSPVAGRPGRLSATARPDRRVAILQAAEKLFASYGYHAVTIRQIAGEAQVPLALVGYYYGQKHELFHAVFEHWRGTIEQRLALLQAACDSPRDACFLRRIVEAFVNPVLALRASPEGEHYAMLVARELAHRTPGTERVLADYFDPMAHAFIDALLLAFPQASRAAAARAYQYAMGALLHHISDYRIERLSQGAISGNDPEAGTALTVFVTAGIHAVLSEA